MDDYFLSSEEIYLSEANIALSACISDNEREYLHCGVLYKSDSGIYYFFHLAFHHLLGHDPVLFDDIKYKHIPFTEDSISPTDTGLLIELFDLLLSGGKYIDKIRLYNHKGLDYGISFKGGRFNLTSGEFIPTIGTNGITCATFIISVFNSLSLFLINPSGWWEMDSKDRRIKDREWGEYIISMLESSKQMGDSLLHQNRESISEIVRFRPEEIVVSPLFYPSASFSDCENLGNVLKGKFFQ